MNNLVILGWIKGSLVGSSMKRAMSFSRTGSIACLSLIRYRVANGPELGLFLSNCALSWEYIVKSTEKTRGKFQADWLF